MTQQDGAVADARRQPDLVPDAATDRLLLVEQWRGRVEVHTAEDQQRLLTERSLQSGVVAHGAADRLELGPQRLRRRGLAGLVHQLDGLGEHLVLLADEPRITGDRGTALVVSERGRRVAEVQVDLRSVREHRQQGVLRAVWG